MQQEHTNWLVTVADTLKSEFKKKLVIHCRGKYSSCTTTYIACNILKATRKNRR